jgi:hypothetical protein
VGALKQYWLYSQIAKRGASDAWVRAGKERALMQMLDTLRDAAELIGAIICALMVALALYILTGGM